jgi:hypothetical protein
MLRGLLLLDPKSSGGWAFAALICDGCCSTVAGMTKTGYKMLSDRNLDNGWREGSINACCPRAAES